MLLVPRNKNVSPPPPGSASEIALTFLALVGRLLKQIGKPGAALERWALKRLGVYPPT
jgi:hypothetical protein